MAIEWINEKDLQEIRDEEKLNPPIGGVVDEETLKRIAELEQLKTEVELANVTIAEILMLLPMLEGGGEL